MNWKAAKTSACLSLLFLVVYGTCNWLTSLRAGVGSFQFAWERHIPFVPALILPYMSIDLFFIAAPFLCRTDRERRTLAWRIAASILIAGACFLLLPLRVAFERPQVAGWLGMIFNNFRTLDRPFNQFPSLHIALCLILAGLYFHHAAGLWRAGVVVWFTLIALSAVLTYQHQVVDVAGGLALAVVCVHLFGDEPLRQPVSSNRCVGGYYLAGAVLLAALGFFARPWGWWLLWPAGSLALVTGGYWGLGAGIYRKSRGRLPLSTWLVLWPVLLGQRLSLAYYARRGRGCRAWDVLTERVWIGRRLAPAEARAAANGGITAVLDLTGEFAETPGLRALSYCQEPILDLTAPTPAQLDRAVEFITRESARGVVYVHCKVGYSRTAAVAEAYLLTGGGAASAEKAMEMLRAARPSIVIRPEVERAIREYAARRDGASAAIGKV